MKPAPIPEIAIKNMFVNLVFYDDFESIDTIDVNNTREPGYKWYVSRPDGTAATPDDYKVENGVLTLQSASGNWTLCSMDWESQTGFAFHQGVLQMRVRIPNPKKAEGHPSVWSVTPEKLNNTASEYVEVDWMEYKGDGEWSTTFKHVKVDPEQDPAEYYRLSNYPNNTCPENFLDGEWHTLTFMWINGKVEGWIDGERCTKQTFYEGVHPDPLPYVEIGETKNAYKVLNDTEKPEVLILGGTKDCPLEIDWIRVWNDPKRRRQ